MKNKLLLLLMFLLMMSCLFQLSCDKKDYFKKNYYYSQCPPEKVYAEIVKIAHNQKQFEVVYEDNDPKIVVLKDSSVSLGKVKPTQIILYVTSYEDGSMLKIRARTIDGGATVFDMVEKPSRKLFEELNSRLGTQPKEVELQKKGDQ